MAFKIGKLEIGYRLLISLTAIAGAYGYLGSHLCTLLRYGNYLVASLLLMLSIAGIFAIPQSLGGLLAAIAAVATVYWQSSNLTYTLVTALVCLMLYLLSFPDLRYDPQPDKKLSIIEIVVTIITIIFTLAIAIIILQTQPSSKWLTSIAIGVIAGAITLIGKQLSYIDLSQKTIWRSLGTLAMSSLAIGFVIRAILYATTKAVILSELAF